MTDLERALAAGAKPVESDYDRALAAGATPHEPPKASLLDRGIDAVKGGVNAAATMVGNALDTATLGTYRRARNAVEGLIDPKATASMQSGEDSFNEAHPFAANLSRDAGYFVPGGAPARLAEAASAGTRAIAGSAPKLIARGLTSRPVAGAIAGAVTAGGTQAAEDVSGGAPLDADLAKRSGRAAAIGGVFGGGAGTIGAVGSKAAKAIRDPKTLVGRAVADVEAAGGRTKPFGGPVEGGVYESPEMQSLPHGKEGYNQLAYQEGQNITAHNENKLAGAREDYGKRLGERLDANGDANHFAVHTHNMLDRFADENTVNGVVGDPHLANAIDKTRQMLTKGMGPQGEQWPAVSVPDLIKTKRLVSALAEPGMPATAENRPYRMIAGSLARELEHIDPAITGLNREYAGTMSSLERANDIIYGSNKAEIASRAAKERRAAQFLGRVGDDTQAGTAAEPQLRELADLDPAYADSITKVKAKKAQERLRYGFPEVSTNIEKAGHSFVKTNLDAAKARIALPVAEAMGRIGPSPMSLMYLPEAVRTAVEARRKLEQR